jgi:hypothetical protein
MPTSTDLVTDLPADFEVFGQAVDTSLADLKGGTTGQVLAKASNTNMDFSWVAIDPLVILDAKGDLITATAADTPARLAVGTNDQVLTADSTTATGLKWATASSGGMTLLSTVTASAASSVSFTSIPSTYTNLLLTWEKVYSDIVDNAYWDVRFNNDTTSDRHIQSGTYWAGSTTQLNRESTAIGGNFAAAPLQGGFNGADLFGYNGYGAMIVYNYSDASRGTGGNYYASNRSGSGAYRYVNSAFIYETTSAISRIDFIRNSTQTVTGTFRLYGVA